MHMPDPSEWLTGAPGPPPYNGQGITQICRRHAKSFGEKGLHFRKKGVSRIEPVYPGSPKQLIHEQAITFHSLKLVLHGAYVHVVKRRDFAGVALAARGKE